MSKIIVTLHLDCVCIFQLKQIVLSLIGNICRTIRHTIFNGYKQNADFDPNWNLSDFNPVLNSILLI